MGCGDLIQVFIACNTNTLLIIIQAPLIYLKESDLHLGFLFHSWFVIVWLFKREEKTVQARHAFLTFNPALRRQKPVELLKTSLAYKY